MDSPRERKDGASGPMSDESHRKYVVRALAEDGSTLTDEEGTPYEAENWVLDCAFEEILARDLPRGTRLDVGWFAWPDPLKSEFEMGRMKVRAKTGLPASFTRRTESLGLRIGDDGSLYVV